MEQEKRLSYNIERGKHDAMTWTNEYTYKFRTSQYLEQIDDLSEMSSYTYNEIKQMCVDNLVSEFRMALNNVVFGDPAGKDYVEAVMSNKNYQPSKEMLDLQEAMIKKGE